jgi:hypothetical protein
MGPGPPCCPYSLECVDAGSTAPYLAAMRVRTAGALLSFGTWRGSRRSDRYRLLLRRAGGDLRRDPGWIGACDATPGATEARREGIKDEGEPSEKDLAGRRNRR